MLKRFWDYLKIWFAFKIAKIKLEIRPKPIDNPVSTEKEAINEVNPIVKEVEFFARANSLRDEFFDDPPRVYTDGEVIFEGQKMRAISSKLDDDEWVDDVPDTYSPWEDYEKYPKKTHELTPAELKKAWANGEISKY